MLSTAPMTGNADRSRTSALLPSRLKISGHMVTRAWHRGRVKISCLLRNEPPQVHTIPESTCRFPYEIVEMIISHLTRDLSALKACSLTCRSWHVAVVPRIFHTLLLRKKTPGPPHTGLDSLSGLYERGLMPLVKKIQVEQLGSLDSQWFMPEAFNPDTLHYFSRFANVETLKIQGLNICRFMPRVEGYFGHLAPALRSITLHYPIYATQKQLAFFLSLFSNLNDVDIRQPFLSTTSGLNWKLVPFSSPKFRGKLTLCNFRSIEGCTHLIAASDGLRFRHMDLREVAGCAPTLLGACTETLESLRFYVTDDPGPHPLFHEFDLSRLKVLRSLEVASWTTELGLTSARNAILMQVFSTITSPVFSELVIVIWCDQFARALSDVTFFDTLRTMNEVRPFKLVFLLQTWSQYVFPWEKRRMFEEAIKSATEGPLDFLDRPPTLRLVQLDP